MQHQIPEAALLSSIEGWSENFQVMGYELHATSQPSRRMDLSRTYHVWLATLISIQGEAVLLWCAWGRLYSVYMAVLGR